MSTFRKQLEGRATTGAFHAVHPTDREVLLARLLLRLIDELGMSDTLDVNLYNQVKCTAEPIVRKDAT